MHSLHTIRHKINNDWRVEVMSLLVIFSAVTLLGMGRANLVVNAMVVQTVALNSGDEIQVGCKDGRLPTTSISGLIVRVGCALVGVTPTPTTPPVVVSTNLVDNSGFDAGTQGWTVSGTTISGGTANLVGGNAYVSQRINQKLQSGQTYTISAEVRVTNPGGVTWGGPQLGIGYYPDLGDSSIGFVRASRTLTSTQVLTMDKTVTDASRSIYVGVRNFGFDGSVVVDNVRVYVKGTSGGTGVTPTAPTATTMPPMTTTAPAPGGSTSTGNSFAFGAWDPNDAKFAATGPQKYPACSKATHDSYYVVGPDGKKYPTWHPALGTDVTTGQRCSFGHEHGRNPAGYAFFNELKSHFAYDGVDGCPRDGQITSCETNSSHTGIPFAYVNEQLAQDSSIGFMRHEDHVGHKIEFANGEGDIGDGTDPFSSSMTGGVYAVFEGRAGEPKFIDSGVHCYQLHKIHQGVHSPDALTNNLHEFISHEKCTSTNANYAANSAIISAMIAFGNSGEFTQFCGADRNTIIKVSAPIANYPGGGGFRNIITKDCVDRTMLVPAGQFSAFAYEDWDSNSRPALFRADGSLIAAVKSGGWEVLDAIRYYDPTKASKISYFADLCNIRGDRQFRGGQCSDAPLGLTWNDTRSPFKGLHRGQYMSAPTLNNAGGPTVWYTDAMGRKGSTSPFPGSIKQYVSSVKADFDAAAAAAGRSQSPRIVLRRHDNGEGTVHAPN